MQGERVARSERRFLWTNASVSPDADGVRAFGREAGSADWLQVFEEGERDAVKGALLELPVGVQLDAGGPFRLVATPPRDRDLPLQLTGPTPRSDRASANATWGRACARDSGAG
jgi:hypothetical protein